MKKKYEYKIFTIQRTVSTLKARWVKHYSNKNPTEKNISKPNGRSSYFKNIFYGVEPDG